MNVDLYRNGLVKISGLQYTMPSHEAWVRWNGAQTWNSLFHSSATHLYCLILGGNPIAFEHPPVPSEEPTDFRCIQGINAQLNRSTDRWISFDQSGDNFAALTRSGKLWLRGSHDFIAPFDVANYCYVTDIVNPMSTGSRNNWRVMVPGYGKDGLVIGRDGTVQSFGNGRLSGVADEDWKEGLKAVSGTYRDVFSVGGTVWALNNNGDLVTWGRNTDYDKAWADTEGIEEFYQTPQVTSTGHDFVQVVADGWAVNALDSAGNVWARVDALGDENAGGRAAWTWRQVTTGGNITTIAYNQRLWALDDRGHLWNDPSDQGSSLEESGDPVTYSYLQSAHNVVLVTDSNGNVFGVNGDERVPIDGPGMRGAVMDAMNFLAADGDWYEARYDWDESGEPSVTWVNMGVPPTVAPTAENVHSYCSDNS